jgi:hypothetical protein
MSLKKAIYSNFPGLDVIAALEQIAVVDVAPAETIQGTGDQRAVLVGEFLKGDFNTPTSIAAVSDLKSLFGWVDRTITTKPEKTSTYMTVHPSAGYEGNGVLALARKRFASLAIVRAKTAIKSASQYITFTLTRTAASTTADGSGSSSTSLQVASVDGFQYVRVNGENIAPNSDNPLKITLGGTEADVVDVDAATKTLTLSEATSWDASDAVVRVLDDYTLPAGTVISGENDDADSVEAALMDDVSFSNGATTATAFLRPITANVCEKGFGVGAYSGALDTVETASVSGNTCPKTTLLYSGDAAYPYVDGQTMGSSAVSHGGFTCESWGNIVNYAYANAIGYASNPGGAYSSADPAGTRRILFCARHWAGGDADDCSAIRSAMASHVADSASGGVTVVALSRPPFDTARDTSIGSSDPGVAANRTDRLVYCFPEVKQLFPELDASNSIDMGWDTWMASILSQLAPEEDPGQYHNLADGRGITAIKQIRTTAGAELRDLNPDDYKTFRQKGVCAPAFSESYGWTCYSGVTSSVVSGRTEINRRRMADYVTNRATTIVERYKSTLERTKRNLAILDALEALGEELKSEEDPDLQRIDDYSVQLGDVESGVQKIDFQCKLLGTSRSFLINLELGTTVTITTE